MPERNSRSSSEEENQSPQAARSGQAFISFRHAEPDESLAKALDVALISAGYETFIDHKIEVGSRWADEIDRELRRSSYFIVIISEESIQSDMVRMEIAIAHELEQSGSIKIFPVKADYNGRLPYDIASKIEPFQYTVWRRPDTFEGVCSEIVSAIDNSSLAQSPSLYETSRDFQNPILELSREEEAPGEGRAPLPAADPRVILDTGTVRLKSPYYLEREADRTMKLILAGNVGETLVIKGTHQTGKSSLLARARALAIARGHRAIYLDFQQCDAAHLENLDTLMQFIARAIAASLNLERSPDAIWDEKLGSKLSFSRFLENVIFPSLEGPMLLAIDDIDRVFEKSSYRDDFFQAVRGWHENRAFYPQWEKLHLVISHSTDPALWIRNIDKSPFNVGERVWLKGFTTKEIAELNNRYGRPVPAEKDLVGLQRLLGGHPYLIRKSLHILSQYKWSISRLHEEAAQEDGPFGDHLRYKLYILHKPGSSSSLEALKEILTDLRCSDEMSFQRLKAAGIVARLDNGAIAFQSVLYEKFFERHLPRL